MSLVRNFIFILALFVFPLSAQGEEPPQPENDGSVLVCDLDADKPEACESVDLMPDGEEPKKIQLIGHEIRPKKISLSAEQEAEAEQ